MVSLRAHLAGAAEVRPLITRILLPIACACLLASSPDRARAADNQAVLDAWFAAQTNLRTWQASFTQTRSLKTFKQPLVTSGRVWVKPPNRYRWELGTPAQTIALRQADELLVIYPGLKRVERYPAGDKASGPWGDALALIEAGFPRDRAELESRLRILSLTEARGVWTFALQPRSAAARRMMPEIRLGLAASDFSLVNTELVLTDGSTLRNDFTNAVLNSALDAALFDWTPPADFTISEPLRK